MAIALLKLSLPAPRGVRRVFRSSRQGMTGASNCVHSSRVRFGTRLSAGATMATGLMEVMDAMRQTELPWSPESLEGEDNGFTMNARDANSPTGENGKKKNCSKKAALLDQFGVLHDGQKAYPHAIEAVRYLKEECDLTLLILSNSSRRSCKALGNLEKMGFDTSMFAGVVTSGEVTHKCLEQRLDDFWKARRRCLHFTWGDRGAVSLEGLGVEVVPPGSDGGVPEDIDCIIAHGTECVGTRADGKDALPLSLEDMKVLIQHVATKARESGREIPMIVANPDVVTVHGEELRVMPGTFASWYEECGGTVVRMGKPADIIYKEALRMLDMKPHEVFAVGDSIEHDIIGASAMGIESVFVMSGIHKAEINVKSVGNEGEARMAGLEKLFSRFSCHPSYSIHYFAK